MFKTKEEVIIIQAEAKEPIATRAVFWSHDKGTAKLIFELQKNNVDQSLSEGTIVPVVLDFNSETAENGRGRHIYHAEIVDALNGIVSIVLEDNILGYVGRVDGSVYIELPDSRSLDTAGRFTFDIKRSPIDENVPELEDYYWQGFNEIMAQYHQTIATIKLEAKTLLDSLTADVTKVKNDIATANVKIAEIRQKLDDNDVFTKQESSTNVVDQIIGKENVTFTVTLDLKNKVATSIVENQNSAYTFYGSTALMTPGTGFEVPQTAYDQISTLDSSSFSLTRTAVNEPAQMLIKWNILEIAKKSLGEKYFKINGATDKASQIELLRAKLSSLSGSIVGFGSGPGGNKLNLSSWRKADSTWQYRTPHSNAVDTRISSTIVAASVFAYIDDDGFYHNLVYAETCDGVTPSKISVNYVSAQFKLNISANEQIELMIANDRVENLATQAEAETATDNTKTMTPLRTKQLLDSKLLNMVYPIGSIYTSVNSATPATLFGGTWERFAKGQVLVGVNEDDTDFTSGKTGGEKKHTLQITNDKTTNEVGFTTTFREGLSGYGLSQVGTFVNRPGLVLDSATSYSPAAHNNLQPYIAVYMWKRIA